MTKKRMMADVLWEAANEHLSPVAIDSDVGKASAAQEFSCHAIYLSMFGARWQRLSTKAVDSWLSALGCNPDRAAFYEDFDGHERQGVRYMWLLLAMHVAEDEGVTL